MSENQDKITCIKCGKLIPRSNSYCYTCGAQQVAKGASPEITSLSDKSQNIQLRCVRCESTDSLESYIKRESFKKKERGLPYTTVYTARPYFTFPVCYTCLEDFNKWKKLNWVFGAIVALWLIIGILIRDQMTLMLGLLNWIIIAVTVFGLIFVSYLIFYYSKNNPSKWMRISGFFSEGLLKYKGLVYSKKAKKWIEFEKWVSQPTS